MSEMLGADVEELRALAKEFSGKSQSLTQAQRLIDGAVNQLPRYWQGPDAQRFAAQWRGQHRGIISRTAGMLDETAEQLKTNSTEQEKASSVASLSGPAGGPGAGPGGFGGGGGTFDVEDRPFWEADPNKNWWENNVARPWDIYKFVPDTLRTMELPFKAGDSLLKLDQMVPFMGQNSSVKALLQSDAFVDTGKALGKAAGIAEGGEKVFSVLGKVKTFGNILGGVGVAVDLGSAINSFSKGDEGAGYWSLAKAGLGAAALVPGPQQPFLIAANVGIAIYENREKVAEVATAVGDGVSHAAASMTKAVGDGVAAVAKDPGKLLPWNW